MQETLKPTRHPAGCAKIIVTKGNPSRGKGYEVSHFIVNRREIKSISDRDQFFPNITKAAKWVLSKYPSAKLATGRRSANGRLAGLCFQCNMADFFPSASCRSAH